METRNALGECVLLTGQLLAEHVSSQQYLLKLFNEHTAILSRILETRKKEVGPSSATETQEQCSEIILRHLDAHTGPKLSSPVPNSPPESTLLALRAMKLRFIQGLTCDWRCTCACHRRKRWTASFGILRDCLGAVSINCSGLPLFYGSFKCNSVNCRRRHAVINFNCEGPGQKSE
jgi:hypothetical protein